MIERLPSKPKALSSNSSITKQNKTKTCTFPNLMKNINPHSPKSTHPEAKKHKEDCQDTAQRFS
jgi:hypothetical protein